MRRFMPFIALASIALLCAPAQAGASKKFEKYGFSWTLPSGDWQFNPMSPSDVNAGFVAKAACTAASVEAIIYTKPTDGLSLGERVQEMKDRGGDGLGEAVRSKVLDTTLSGVKGKVVVQRIKADGGARGQFRKYAIISDGKFYQMLIRSWHGAHESAKDEVNGIRKGFRLLKGAGGPDKDETLTEIGGSQKNQARPEDDDDDSEDDEDSSGDDDDDDGWGPPGPTKTGNKVCLPSHNLEWTIPTDSPFRWVEGIENEKAKEGMFLAAQARMERKKKEFEKDTPDYNQCRISLVIQETPPGHKPVKWVKSSQLQDDIRKDVFKGETNNSKTLIKDKVRFGNVKAAYLKMEGKIRGGPATYLYFQKSLKGELYSLRVLVRGHVDRMKQFNKPLGQLLKGLRFVDTKEPQAGPLLTIVPDFAAKRGSGLGKEKNFNGPGYTFKKPKFMAKVNADRSLLSMNRDFKNAFEGRSEDGEAYLYFEIRNYKLNISNTPNPDPEKFVEKRGQDWLAGAGDGASIGGKKGKLKFKNGKFGTAKGLTYKFTGVLEKAPFIEEGWVVKHKNTMLWLKMQYGGKDAEKKLKPLAKKVRKAMKFKK